MAPYLPATHQGAVEALLRENDSEGIFKIGTDILIQEFADFDVTDWPLDAHIWRTIPELFPETLANLVANRAQRYRVAQSAALCRSVNLRTLKEIVENS